MTTCTSTVSGSDPSSIAEVVTSGLCIGCGLCASVTEGRVTMRMTDYGSLRPYPVDSFTTDESDVLMAACPGATARPRPAKGASVDPVWGAVHSMAYAWAGDPDIRFRAATGGVLTALGVHLLSSGQANFVLQVMADPEAPMRSRTVFSETPEDVVRAAGSRYGPTAPLADLHVALDRAEPFAVIAKPCDLGALHALSRIDPRVDDLVIARLAMVCGGQSRLGKSSDLLAEFDLDEEDLTLYRYRGYGNPGRTRIETQDGRAFEKTYTELWEDESGWQLETRCKLCPDALGEAADVAALDVWPGGGPTGEDAGINGIVTRSAFGQSLVASAVAAGDLVLGQDLIIEQLNDFQPHQVRKKQALSARYAGRSQAGFPNIATQGLRLDTLGDALSAEVRAAQIEGAARRARSGKMSEPL